MKKEKDKWNVVEILNTTAEYLKNKDIENPRLNAERLLSFVLQIDRVQLYLQFDRLLNENEKEKYRALIRRRVNHEPLQYLTGETEFMSLPFHVSPAALIPRPETEILVERILELKNKYLSKEVCIWDIGTGSGCIAVSLAHYWQQSKIIASDISIESLEIARQNAQLNSVSDKISFMAHDILSEEIPSNDGVNIVVSNPPYISRDEIDNLDIEIKNYEPEGALTDYSDGTVFYRKILSLTEKKLDCEFIFFELSGTQPDIILKLTDDYNFKDVNVFKDLNNLPRVLEIKVK